ncbi:MAG: hypothetical protein ACRDLY_13450, partial [Thermoleophilaceae bacterium]
MIAHISGVPAEELPPPLTGTGAEVLVARGWIMVRLRRRREALRVREKAHTREGDAIAAARRRLPM